MGADQPIPDELRDPRTPAEVVITRSAPPPVTDPTLGIEVPAPSGATPKHRLVSIGDSLTQGFQSFAIFNTDISYPALIARELGCYDSFVHPEYPAYGGLPLNLEYIIRSMERQVGKPDWWNAGLAIFDVRRIVDQVERFWETGPGATVPQQNGINNNLAVYGWDLRDVLSRTADTEQTALNGLLNPGLAGFGIDPLRIVKHFEYYIALCSRLAGLYVLDSAREVSGAGRTVLDAAHALADQGGIETLIVFIGANNALGTVLDLNVRWSGPNFDELPTPSAPGKDAYNVWLPSHFASEFVQIAAAVRSIGAQHVIWGTVPHVTIVPLAHGIGGKSYPGSRYFPYYTRPWITDKEFDPNLDPHLTANEARAIDSAIDQYNETIVEEIKTARGDRLDWLLLDTCGILDRVAARRYVNDTSAQPGWWEEYPLPAAIAAMIPTVDSQFFTSTASGRRTGGLFALDGIHPTTVGYGILAEEFIKVMAEHAHISFPGPPIPPAPGTRIDFRALLGRDTLLSDPPPSIGADLEAIRWLNEGIDLGKRVAAAAHDLL